MKPGTCNRFASLNHSAGMKYKWILLLAFFSGTSLLAQKKDTLFGPRTNTVDWTPDSYQILDINNIQAPIIPHAEMFWHRDHQDINFMVPKNSGKKTIFVSSLWIGAQDQNDSTYVAAATYNQAGSDYQYGILDGQGNYDTGFSRVAGLYIPVKLRRWEVDTFRQSGHLPGFNSALYEKIIKWPGMHKLQGQLAPYRDHNGNGVYDPDQGEYPIFKGDEAIFRVFNDDMLHFESQSLPMKLEIQALTYAYQCDDIPETSPDFVINNTVFNSYTIINRSDRDYHDVYLGQWTDFDLGDGQDDFVGCDTALDFSFAYNADNFDADYGPNPPTQAVVFLDQELVNFTANRPELLIPGKTTRKERYYAYLSSSYPDGSPFVDANGDPLPAQFCGNPYTSHGERDTVPGDKRTTSATGPFDLKSGDTLKFTLAFVFSHESQAANGLQTSIKKMKSDVQRIRSWHTQGSFPNCVRPNSIRSSHALPSIHIYPNPGADQLYIQVSNPSTFDRIMIIDAQGKTVYDAAFSQEKMHVSTGQLAEGVYHIRVTGANSTVNRLWMKTAQ